MKGILDILAELDQMADDTVDPTGPNESAEVQANDKVLGSVGMRARKLRTLINKRCDEGRVQVEALVAKRFETPIETLKAKLRLMEKDANTLNLLKEAFWNQVRSGLEEEFDAEIEIKKGWVVVAAKDEEPILMTLTAERLYLANQDFLRQTNCGDQDCEIHGHLNRQQEESEVSSASNIN